MNTNHRKQLQEKLWAAAEQLRANDYSLNPGRYIEIIANEMDDVDFETRMHELMAEFKNLTAEAHQLEAKIMEDWGKIL
ncbi:MAG: hypothetical protein A3F12_05250 [Gammaproteobacteria bacterium RIFCSPHIGHO2_12_FULL_38_14]|nr:MAG: hypothetical protein A3F12_05250 [Gammaproteobacteria bacterium RIFCSPHIGHO2_12_FULL_38_14]